MCPISGFRPRGRLHVALLCKRGIPGATDSGPKQRRLKSSATPNPPVPVPSRALGVGDVRLLQHGIPVLAHEGSPRCAAERPDRAGSQGRSTPARPTARVPGPAWSCRTVAAPARPRPGCASRPVASVPATVYVVPWRSLYHDIPPWQGRISWREAERNSSSRLSSTSSPTNSPRTPQLSQCRAQSVSCPCGWFSDAFFIPAVSASCSRAVLTVSSPIPLPDA